ncbi:MAG: peptidoglycan D,D-transpeptidase FtsI family protein [Gaiellaceae bacterium]
MNLQIRRLGVVSLVLILALIVGTTYWQVWAAPDLADKQDNAISLIAQYTIKRGLIYASDGRTVIAANRVVRTGNRTFYNRRYPLGSLFAHPVGYATQARSRTGLESSANAFLTGADTTLATQLRRVANNLVGSPIDGSSIVTTLNIPAQRVAMEALAGKCGGAVALDPKTGKVYVMASQPSYDPNDVERHYRRISRITSPGCSPAAPLLDRATAGLFVPGSSFKVITATAALDSGKFTPSSTFNDPGYCIEYGKHVSNFSNPEGAEVFGGVNFSQALQHSINSVFCNVGIALGPYPILDYAKKYGFYSPPPIDLPREDLRASGLYDHNRLFWPANASQVDVGRLAFGQERMLVSPLQMAEVAATVANGGVRMQPYLVDRVIRPNGKEQTSAPHALGRVMKPETASELTTMMEAVVTGGTGTAAQIPGVRVAGKTGTGETGNAPGSLNTTWFIAFAPADAPRVAVAVVLENQTGVGGTTAAPIARAIMQALLSQAANP